MEPDAKLRKLAAFRYRTRNVSQNAFADMCELIEHNGLPEVYDRKSQRKARKNACDVVTPYGPLITSVLVRTTDGDNTVPVKVLNLWAFFWYAYKNGGSFRDVIRKRFGEHPTTPENPAHLILYGDEVIPGVQVAYRHSRKFWALYAALREIGPLVLSNPDMWATIATLQSELVQQTINAGISQVFRHYLRLLFLGPQSPTVVGITIGEVPHEIRIHIKFGAFCQDGAAQSLTFGCLGDGAIHSCLRCVNYFADTAGLVTDGDTELTDDMVDVSRFRYASDNDIWAAVDRLTACYRDGRTAIEKKRLSQVSGLRFEPEGLLADVELRPICGPISSRLEDPMHGVWVKGLFQTVAYVCLETLFLLGHTALYESVFSYLDGWCVPAMWGSFESARTVFSDARVKSWRSAKKLKATGSESLMLFLVLEQFLLAHIYPEGPATCRAYFACCRFAEVLNETPFSIVEPTELHKRVMEFLTACVEASWRPFFIISFIGPFTTRIACGHSDGYPLAGS